MVVFTNTDGASAGIIEGDRGCLYLSRLVREGCARADDRASGVSGIMYFAAIFVSNLVTVLIFIVSYAFSPIHNWR